MPSEPADANVLYLLVIVADEERNQDEANEKETYMGWKSRALTGHT